MYIVKLFHHTFSTVEDKKKKIQALTRFMLLVGDPLKDSGSNEENERKNQVRRFSPIVGPHINKNAPTEHYGK